MLKDILTSTAEWGWRPRIYISLILVLISILVQGFYEQFWVWGYAGAAFLLTVPFFFKETHVEFNEEKAEELILTKWSIGLGQLKDFLIHLNIISEKGFDEIKVNLVLTQVEKLQDGEMKLFNYYVTTSQTKSSLGIKISKNEELILIEFTSNILLNDLIKAYIERQ